MSDIVGLSGYLAVGVGLLLLGAALVVSRRSGRTPTQVGAASPHSCTITQPSWAGDVSRSSSARDLLKRPNTTAVLRCTILAVAAVGLAAWEWNAAPALGPFWLLLIVGAAFAVFARRGLGWFDETPDNGSDRASSLVLRPAGLLLISAALAAEAGALGLFWLGRGLSLAWLLHLGAAGLLLLGLWRLAPPVERRLIPGWARRDAMLLAGISLAALLVRVWRLGTIPEGLWFDESQRGLEAIRMLAERGYRPIFAAGTLQEPTGLWFLMMPMIEILGRDAVALRLPVAVAGAAGVGAVYLLGRALYGPRVALVAAGFAVALTWHLNFSRIALPAVISVTCDTVAAMLFVVALRRQSRFLLATAGMACAAGLYFYFTSQLMPFVLAALAGQQLIARRLRLPRATLAGLALCAASYVLVAGPIELYAVTRTSEFAARANAVNVFRDVENAHSWQPVVANLRAHLLMFHVAGDNNGRHNWSGHPMLDPVTGGLMMAGLALAISRFWRLEQTLLLVWIPVALAGGVLSSIWDAPQAHRSIDAVIPAVMLAALPVGLLWQAADRIASGAVGSTVPAVRASLVRLIPATLVVGLVMATDAANLDRFFRVQQQDEKTWTDFMAPQTIAGREAAGVPGDMRVYLEPNWVGHPSVRFVDPLPHDDVPFDPGSHLPVTSDSAAIFISDRPDVAERIAALYPAAVRTYTRAPNSDRVAGYGFVLAPEVAQSTRGVVVRYEGAAGTVERREPTISQNWPDALPMPSPFSAVWTATLTVPTYAEYRLRLDGPASLALSLDGVETVQGGAAVSARLARGNHQLRLTGTDLGGQPIRLLWAPPNQEFGPIPPHVLNSSPVETNGLLGRVYRGSEAAGAPVIEQVDPNVELRVHLLPAPRPYTMEWQGAIRADYDGPYRFSLSSLGASTIWLDGAQVAHKEVPEGLAEGEVTLRRGWHDVRVRYVDSVDFSYVTAFWQPPGAERQAIPPSELRPWPADRVTAARPEDTISP